MREIKVFYADSFTERVNEMMRKFDVGWGPDDGAVPLVGTIKTENELPLEEYAKLLERVFQEADPGSRIYDVQEITSTRLGQPKS